MVDDHANSGRDALGAWAKRCYFAGRAIMEEALRPHDIGATQFYVLHELAGGGPTQQRELVRALQVERATMSVVIRALVSKGVVEQVSDETDKRRKLLRLTPAGEELFRALPDLRFIRDVAFAGIADADIAVAVRVLRTATERLGRELKESRE